MAIIPSSTFMNHDSLVMIKNRGTAEHEFFLLKLTDLIR